MTSWARRCLMLAILLGIQYAHSLATSSLENTPVSMLLYHGSAALCDYMLLLSAPAILRGSLCDRIQWLCLGSVVCNAVGWGLYMAYVPHAYYNVAGKALMFTQWLLLIIPDNYADNPWRSLVRHRDPVSG